MSEHPRAGAADSGEGSRVVVAGLSRDLGLVSALAIGTGTMIAAGIFTLSGLAVGYVGSAAIVSFLLAALVAAFTALTYCEFTSIYPFSGEGYLYARKTFPPLLAYLVGWCLLLGYASSCAFYIASLSSYFNEFIWHFAISALPGIIFLAALTLLNIKGTKESGTFQIVVTAAKIVLLIWFIAGGMGSLDAATLTQRFSTDLPLIASTAALVFITFFGFSAIAASAGEVMNPTKTIPRAIFISMIVVTVLYSLVVLVVVVADLTEYTEAAMGVAARAFLGPIGGMVIVGGAIFSMISASNASILAGSRVALAMSQLRHLPGVVGRIGARTQTPFVALLAVGGAIGVFALLLPLESLAHFANLVLLLALCFVNAALIVHRRRFPEMERPFRVPLVPLVPALGIAANLYLILQIPVQGHLQPLLLAILALALGLFGYAAWRGTRFEVPAPAGPGSRIVALRASPREGAFRILLPVHNPQTAETLVRLAASIAKPRDGEITLLRVVQVPEQLPPELARASIEGEEEVLERLQALEGELGVPITTEVRVGHNVGRAVLESAREDRSHLILLGWKGFTTTARKILGEVTDDVVRLGRADIMLVKFGPERAVPRRILLPTAGGLHSRKAKGYALGMTEAGEGRLTLASVIPGGAPDGKWGEEGERLAEERAELPEEASVGTRVIAGPGVVEGVVAAAADFDAVMVGASGDSFSSRILFGTIPERIAREAPGTVIVLKSHDRVRAFVGRVAAD
ncbi:MAG: amino acid permease [Gemmatimonadetes bacterium]|nr:amino acid permease [Gemmatimonadota bacterium]